jgi:hypothetical protein
VIGVLVGLALLALLIGLAIYFLKAKQRNTEYA